MQESMAIVNFQDGDDIVSAAYSVKNGLPDKLIEGSETRVRGRLEGPYEVWAEFNKVDS